MEFAELLGWALIAVVWELGTDQLPPQHGSMPCGKPPFGHRAPVQVCLFSHRQCMKIGHGSLSPQT